MDYDRKSTVSSFYGGRKSGDALRTEYPPQPAGYASRTRDDASSFFGAERASMDHLSASRPQTAGYNPSSFLNAGREEPVKGGYDEEKPTPEAWDVYADFNNAGPRYSNTYDLGPQNSSGCVLVVRLIGGVSLTGLEQLFTTSTFWAVDKR